MCVFCEIINGSIPSEKVFENDKIVAFKDNAPVSPVHVLVVPREHIESVNGITAQNSAVVAHIFETIPKIAKSQGIDSYRIITNCGEAAGQTVKHLHFHLLGGVEMGNKIL